jgi:predicted DNA-binding protein
MSSITFKLPVDLRKKLEAAAARDGRTISDFIRHHFNNSLPRLNPTKKKGGKR